LPFYLEPESDEALLSWLLRLATRAHISLQVLAHAIFGMDDHVITSAWWRRPDKALLSQLSRATGVPIERLRTMTYCGWQAIHDKDENAEPLFACERAASIRKQSPRPRFAICPDCLQQDAHPYLRLHWMLSWVAVCPQHACFLISMCPQCRAILRLPSFASAIPFNATRCARCAFAFHETAAPRTHDCVVQLQTALIVAQQSGSARLPGIGTAHWPHVLAATKVLLAMVRTYARPCRRAQLVQRIARDFELCHYLTAARGSRRKGDLTILAWLLDRYPHNLRAAVSILSTQKVNTLIDRFDEFDEDTRVELHRIFSACATQPHLQRQQWRRWLDQLHYTATELSARAHSERFKHRRIRLQAFAQLRDGHSIATVAAAAQVNSQTIYRWLRQGAMRGLEAALERPCGRQTVSDAQSSELAQWIAHTPDRGTPGYSPLRTRDVIDEAKSRFAIDLSTHAAGRLLRAHQCRRGQRRRVHSLRHLSPVNLAPVHDLST
jgi:transposase